MKKVLLTIFLTLFIDQFVKIYVKSTMYLGQKGIDLGILQAYFVENKGMAFGLEIPGGYGKIVLSVFRVLAVIAIGWYISTLVKKKSSTILLVAMGLIFAGALGNILDSAFYGLIFSKSGYLPSEVATIFPEGGGYAGFLQGSVVDMLQFTVTYPSWMPFGLAGDEIFPPIFNIADSAITIGLFMIIFGQKKLFKKKERGYEVVSEENSFIPYSGD